TGHESVARAIHRDLEALVVATASHGGGLCQRGRPRLKGIDLPHKGVALAAITPLERAGRRGEAGGGGDARGVGAAVRVRRDAITVVDSEREAFPVSEQEEVRAAPAQEGGIDQDGGSRLRRVDLRHEGVSVATVDAPEGTGSRGEVGR